MKTQKGIIASLFSLFMILFTANVFGETLHNETATFKAYGNCEMCKKRIESALKKNTAIKSADWNVKTKMVTVEYDPHSISIDQVHQLIADAGHDTDKVKANASTYKKLPDCCQYNRKK